LPHIEIESATYFVTFRLADSIPRIKIDQILSERKILSEQLNKHKGQLKKSLLKRYKEVFSKKYDRYLDTGAGKCYFQSSTIAGLMKEALEFHNYNKYDLIAWCIIPNHVHALIELKPEQSLSKIIHSWKSYTSKEANKLLNRKGQFWAPEYYDHIVRHQKELNKVIEYILNNPIKADLIK
jgi:menaquinone-specific isochorismate synthase